MLKRKFPAQNMLFKLATFIISRENSGESSNLNEITKADNKFIPKKAQWSTFIFGYQGKNEFSNQKKKNVSWQLKVQIFWQKSGEDTQTTNHCANRNKAPLQKTARNCLLLHEFVLQKLPPEFPDQIGWSFLGRMQCPSRNSTCSWWGACNRERWCERVTVDSLSKANFLFFMQKKPQS